jgi:ATP-dependent Lon protease
MPSEIQARIAHTIDRAIDTRINPHTLAVHKEVAALSAAEKASSKLIKGTIQDVVRQNATEMQKYTQITSAHLEEKFNALSLSQRTCAASTFRIEDRSRMILEAVYTQTSESRADSKTVQAMALDLFANQSRTTDAIVRAVQQEGQKNTSVSKKRILNLHKKLDHMSSLMGTVNNHMSSLSIARQSARLSTTNSEIETAIGSLRQSLWLLLSALHVLIRELM